MTVPESSPPPPTRCDDNVEIGNVVEQFQRRRALPGDDAPVVVGMDERRAGFVEHPPRTSFRARRSVGSHRRTLPPKPRTAFCFTIAELDGITIHDAIPRRAAAQASAAPWFPEECVTTPFAACASVSESTALHAPRALNAATFCRFSHLKKSVRSSDEVERAAGKHRRALHVRADARVRGANYRQVDLDGGKNRRGSAHRSASRQRLRVGKEHILPGVGLDLDRAGLEHEIDVFHDVLRRRREYDLRIIEHRHDVLHRVLVS